MAFFDGLLVLDIRLFFFLMLAAGEGVVVLVILNIIEAKLAIIMAISKFPFGLWILK